MAGKVAVWMDLKNKRLKLPTPLWCQVSGKCLFLLSLTSFSMLTFPGKWYADRPFILEDFVEWWHKCIEHHLIWKVWVLSGHKRHQLGCSEESWLERETWCPGMWLLLGPLRVRAAGVWGEVGTASSSFSLLDRGPSTTAGLTLALVLYLAKWKRREYSGTRRHELAPPSGDLCYLGTLQNRKMCITK